MKFRAVLSAFSGAICMIGAAVAGEPKSLFATDDPISIRIAGPIREIARNAAKSTEPHAATLTHDGVDYAIALSARGLSRRREETCDFPPLRVEFNDKPDAPSIFDGQKRLKLVTHCRSAASFQQLYLRELAAYRIYNVLTEESFRVRPASVAYVDAASGETVIERTGFFIEDVDDLAKRVGLKEIETPEVELSQLRPNAAARYALFQYMIGNLDWSMNDGPGDEDCCHNTRLIGDRAEPFVDLVPAPYDFDYSGFVDAPYAAPPESVKVTSVKTRRYRGYCMHNDEVRAAAANFLAARPALERAAMSAPGMSKSSQREVLRYLDGFFDAIATPEKLESKLLKFCREAS